MFAIILAMGVPFFISHHLQLGSNAKSPQEVKMSLGSTAVIAGGRAKLWFAGGNTGGDFEVSCSKESQYFQPEDTETAHSACGVDVILVKVHDEKAPPKATFKVTWK